MTAILVPLAPVMVETALNKKKADDYQVWDRAYRIRMNQGQVCQIIPYYAKSRILNFTIRHC